MFREMRLLLIMCLSLLPFFAKAQRADYGKMSSLVREACIVAQARQVAGAKPRLGGLGRRNTITAFVKADGLQPLSGCDVLARYGNLYIASIPLDCLGALSRQRGVSRIEAGSLARATMDTTAYIVGAAALHEAVSFPKAYTGKGVVVGVQDIGFDLTHPDFWSADMTRYRIKALWDQLSIDTVGSLLPVGRDYRDSLSLLRLCRPRDGDTQTHGTHTTGIAAGSGSEGSMRTSHIKSQASKYVGIAPEADICLVCNATSDDIELIDSVDYYKYTYALDALGFKYIFDYADSVGKPCVINFSEGSEEDFRGDDQLYYEMLDSLTGRGHIIVASAGNDGANLNYLRKPADADSMELSATGHWHSKTLDFTTRCDKDFKLQFLSGNGIIKTFSLSDVLAAKDSLLYDSIVVDGNDYEIAVAAYPDSYGSGLVATDWVIASSNYIYPQAFNVKISGDSDVELYKGSAILSYSAKTDGVVADNSHSILSPGSAPSVICAGMTGYRTSFTNYKGESVTLNYARNANGEINENSSVGPTFDGRVKPDVVAPGQNVISSFSSYYIENNPNASDLNNCVRFFTYNGRRYAWCPESGTSMAAPVVTGVIALWLQANPRLSPQDCLEIIAKTSKHHDESLTYPNNVYGYGEIDALAGMELALEKATGIKPVKSVGKERFYSIDGRLAGSNAGTLPKGVYIVGGKKILVK